MNRSAFIYLAGADGTGKSTHAQLLCHRLQRRGIRCNSLWLRFPFFFSLPLLAYARWRGYSWHEVIDGVDYGYWDFRRSWLMSLVFPSALLVDAALASLLRVHLPLCFGVTVVCERFVLDMVVDLAVALDEPTFHQHRLGKLFLRLLPNGARIVILDLDVGTICQRRRELQSDRRLATRLESYRRLASELALPQLSTVGSLERVTSELQNLVEIDDER